MEEASTDTSTQNEKLSFTRDVPLGSKVSRIHLLTPFDTYLTFDGADYSVYDMYYSFQEYPNKAKYYLKASLKDFKYIVFIGFGLFVIILLLTNYKFLKTIPKKLMTMREKRLSALLILLIVGLLTFGALKYFEFNSKLDDLQFEIENLENEVNYLKIQKNDLESNIGNSEAKKKTLYKKTSENYNEETEQETSNRSNYNNTNSDPIITDISIPSTFSKIYLDEGFIIKPEFGNLHYLMSLTYAEFESKMRSNNYSLTTTKESYVNNDTKNVLCLIGKERSSVSMIITDKYYSGMEEFFVQNGVNYKYEDGAKVFNYSFENENFSMVVKYISDSFSVQLERR